MIDEVPQAVRKFVATLDGDQLWAFLEASKSRVLCRTLVMDIKTLIEERK